MNKGLSRRKVGEGQDKETAAVPGRNRKGEEASKKP